MVLLQYFNQVLPDWKYWFYGGGLVVVRGKLCFAQFANIFYGRINPEELGYSK